MVTTNSPRPSPVRQLAANVVGRAWVLFSNIVLMPVYLHILGMQNFGVIALFIAVSGMIAFLDLGLSPTLARELNVQGRSARDRVNLLYTYELTYAAIVGAIVLAALVLPTEAFGLLLSSRDLVRPEVAESVRLVLGAAAAQLLLGFYVAGLLGIEEQVRANLVLVGAGIVRGAVVIVPLLFYPTPGVFLTWQLVTVLAFAVVARSMLYRVIDAGTSGTRRAFEPRSIVENSMFTSGMLLVSLTAAVNTQADKLFIGKLTGLEALARYSLVTTFAQLLVFVVSPITIVLLPRLVRSASVGDHASVRRMFVATHRAVAGLVCAGLASMLFFGPYLISLWTFGRLRPESVRGYAPLLTAGYALLALSTVPHCVAIAHKNLKGAVATCLSIFFTIPGYWLLVREFGVVGAAAMWLLLQSVVVPSYLVWVVRRFIGIPQLGRFLFSTILVPLFAALAVCAAAYQLLGDSTQVLRNLSVIIAAALISLICCLMLTLRPADRAYLLGGRGR